MNIQDSYIYFAIVAVGMTLLLFLLRQVAPHVGLVDIPNERKIHSKPIPLIGGVALFIMSIVALLMTNNVTSFHLYLLIATGLVVAVGLLDDVFQLSALWRFAIQALASLALILLTGVKLYTFGELLYPGWLVDLGYLSVPITVFGVVGVINALNMADGIDGLAAMTFIIPVIVLIYISGLNDFSLWLLNVVVCLFIFIAFNKSKRFKVFLGDNGSLFLGFILSWLLVYYSQGQKAIITPVMALFLVGLPVFDTIFVMLRRIRKGVSPFKPDKTHLHHLFLAFNFTQNQVLFIIASLQISVMAIGLTLKASGVPEFYHFYVFLFLSVAYYFILSRSWKKAQNTCKIPVK